MKSITLNSTVATASLAFCCLFSVASAQTASTTSPDRGSADADAVELSPFVVSESSETGWVANETLAGTRLRTEYKDLGNQIETLTKDFMQDLGLTNFEDALIYTSNTENNTEFQSTTLGNQVNFPNEVGRMRGVGTGTMTRNFFQIHNPTDNYNIERVTVASGPNAILFGLGSPSGIMDATPARARLNRNQYRFELRYDTQDSRRASFDANVAVVPNKLAVRVMGLSKDSYTNKKPNFDKDDRLYGALTFRPFRNTTLVLQAEESNRRVDRAARNTPVDLVTPWYIAGSIPGSGYANRPIYNNSSLAGIASNVIFAQQTANPVLIQGDAGPMRSWNSSVVVKSPAQMPGVDPTFDRAAVFTILHPSIFPFDVNLVGTTHANHMPSRTKTAVLEQKLADNLFLELAYNYENSANELLALGGNAVGGNYSLGLDANRFIPGTTTPNPHAGELYFQGTANSRLQYWTNEDWRATLSYEIDLGRKFGGQRRWMKWLGRHRFAGLYTGSTEETRDQNFSRIILDDPILPGVALRARTFQNWATHPTRLPQFRHYLGDPYEETMAQGPLKDAVSLRDSNGNPYQLHGFETPLTAADGKRLGGTAAVGGGLTKTDAIIAAWQGYFLPDREQRNRLIVTYGWRKDKARTATWNAASRAQNFSGLFPVLWDAENDPYGPSESGINRNLGVVVRPLSWLTLSYNKSTTFDLNVGRFDPFGNPIPGASGDGRDYGIRVDLWKDKLSLRVNKYENTLGPTRAVNQINTYRNQFFNIENRVMVLNPSTPQINVTDGNRNGFPSQGLGGYNMSSNSSGKGYEVELNFSPTSNWNIRLNGSKGEATETNIATEWFAWRDLRLPVWEAVVATNGEVTASGQPVTWATAPANANDPTGMTLKQYYDSALVGTAEAFIRAVDGRSNPTVRSGRINAIVNYRFSEGRLKGFNVGGAVRWRGAPVIGYGTSTSSSGTTVLDLDKVYKGKEEIYVDFFAGYRGRIKPFGGVNYRVQLNVQNLLDEDDPVAVSALTTGAVNQIATVEPRLIALTFGIEF